VEVVVVAASVGPFVVLGVDRWAAVRGRVVGAEMWAARGSRELGRVAA
jgi:hypothetical protein